MRRLFALIAVAGLAVGLYAATAGGQRTASTACGTSCLNKKVATLTKTVSALSVVVTECLAHQAIPVAEFGNPPNTGYLYKFTDGSQGQVTAVDVAAPPTYTPQAYILAVDPNCADTINQPHFRTLLRLLRATPAHGSSLSSFRPISH
jgi:hypothetical protein